MPSGIIMQSSSVGATPEAIEKVLADNGYEVDKPEVKVEDPIEPKRADFASDEEFEKAQEEFEAKQEATAAEEERKAEEKERKAEAAKPPSRRQRAIDKATKKLQEELRKANERLAALEGKKPTEVEQPKLVAPKREDFKSDAEFDEAMFDYRYQLRRAKEDSEAQKKATEDRLKDNWSTYQAAVEEFKDEHDDWDEVVNQSLPLSEAVYFSVLELREDGAQVTYYLGQHPEVLERLNQLSHHSAAMEIARLADKLKGGGAGPTRGVTQKPKPKLPEPVKPVTTAATSSSLTSREAAQKRDYRAFKAAQRRGA